MGEQMFTMKSEVVGRPAVVSDDLLQSVAKKIVKDGASQFQNFRVNFHKFYPLFSTTVLQFGQASKRFAHEFRKCSQCAHNAKNGFLRL
jgi:hypothetical protein